MLTLHATEQRAMSEQVVPMVVEEFAAAIGADEDAVLEAMDEQATREDFPTVGPAVGGWLAFLARTVDARRVFEFGSGFGYSAYWFARALQPDGEVVLTEVDRAELEQAREYFDRGGLTDRARFEHGDAIDIVEEYDGPFDIVLIDNEKHRYREAFEAVESKLRPGSLVIADNAVTAGDVVHRNEVISLFGGDEVDAAEGSRGIATYLEFVRDHETLDTVLLPLGDALAVSRIRE